MPRAKKASFTPKKKKTLTPEPAWGRLQRFATEETRNSAWLMCEDYVHYEITDKELIHSARRWVELQSGWDLTEEVNVIPTSFLLAYGKNCWKARKLEYMPKKVYETLERDFKPILERAHEFRSKTTDPQVLFDMDEENPIHPKKVKEWYKKWKDYLTASKNLEESKDPKLRMEYQIAKTYVYNLAMYLRTGQWFDTHYGENREFKMMTVCKALSYNRDGTVNRTVGTFYPDIGAVWTKEDEKHANR